MYSLMALPWRRITFMEVWSLSHSKLQVQCQTICISQIYNIYNVCVYIPRLQQHSLINGLHECQNAMTNWHKFLAEIWWIVASTSVGVIVKVSCTSLVLDCKRQWSMKAC